MKYAGFLIDIDDTIYDYNFSNDCALSSVIEFCMMRFGLEPAAVIDAYAQAREKVHMTLVYTGSSHNRLLYIEKMLESFGINPLQHGLDIYNIYWDNFLQSMSIYPFVEEFFTRFGENICLVTDLTSHIQYRKLRQLRLSDKVRHIVSSEAVGHEKPHPFIFMQALEKLNLQSHQVCMIGDNFEKDVLGARNVGIDAIWINMKGKQVDYHDTGIKEVDLFQSIKDIL